MIEIRGPNVFKGYWRNPEKTASEFTAEGFFVSGALGNFDATGSLAIVGRAKDLVISGGYNVYPREVQEAIDSLPGVLESAVIGLPDEKWGERVHAGVVLHEGAVGSEAELLAWCKARLAGFKVPRGYTFLRDEEMPRNATGKVLHRALKLQLQH